MYVQIFFFRSHASSDMAFGFIDIQHLPCLFRQSGINLHQPVSYIFMYGYWYLERFDRLFHLLVHEGFVLLLYLILPNH